MATGLGWVGGPVPAPDGGIFLPVGETDLHGGHIPLELRESESATLREREREGVSLRAREQD